MPSYKLCYFNSLGLGEMSRLCFAEAGVEFEDVRYNQTTWPQHKPEMMFGQMPVLFIDGEQIAHSRAAFRYLARKFKLEGDDDVTTAKIDMWVEVFLEGFMKMPFSEQDEKIKEQKTQEVMKEFIIPKLNKIEELIGSTDGPYVFSKFTALDLFLFSLFEMTIVYFKTDSFLEGVPKARALMKAVRERPKIAAWIKNRPPAEN